MASRARKGSEFGTHCRMTQDAFRHYALPPLGDPGTPATAVASTCNLVAFYGKVWSEFPILSYIPSDQKECLVGSEKNVENFISLPLKVVGRAPRR